MEATNGDDEPKQTARQQAGQRTVATSSRVEDRVLPSLDLLRVKIEAATLPRVANERRMVLFTAQEPSGDAHAAPVIARLRERYPEIEPVAWGGPKMEAAGATMLGRTADDGVMGLAGISKVVEVKRLHDEIVSWASKNPVAVHMPVDSPSANYPLCARLKPMGIKVVNLVAPQLWAWAPWRIGKVRRLSDILLCLLPFEEEWFRSRGVVAKFIGHPLLSKPIDVVRADAEAAALPAGAPKIVLLPGSRSSEVRANGLLIAKTFALVRARHPQAAAIVFASNSANAERFLAACGGVLPDGVRVMVAGRDGTIEGAIRWADVAIAVSGTVSLDCTRQSRPVVGVYRTSWIEATLAGLVLRGPNRLLPNIVAGRRIVPEFVPYAGGPEPIAREVLRLIDDAAVRSRTVADLDRVVAQFMARDPAPIAAEVLAQSVAGKRLDNAALDQIVTHAMRAE
jgi:lipid-A-disaccharide synthase